MSPRARAVLAEVAGAHGVTVADLQGPRQDRKACHARQEAMSRLRALQRPSGELYSFPFIGKLLNRDHTTVMFGVRQFAKRQPSTDLHNPVGRQHFVRNSSVEIMGISAA